MPKFTAAERAYIKRQGRQSGDRDNAESEELNIVPFLDIVMNVMMFLLASITTIFTASSPIAAPAPGPPTLATNLTVKIVAEGYIVGAPGGYLQSGCTAVGPAVVAVPLRLGQHDARGLTECLVRARSQPDFARITNLRSIQIASNGSIPYHVLVRTLDATRETRPGAADLFTAPMLGILK